MTPRYGSLMAQRSHADPRGRADVGSAHGGGAIETESVLRTSVLDELAPLMPMEPDAGLRVLEIGTDRKGGASAVELANRAGGSVVSISQSSAAVSRARAARAADGRLEFRRASFTAGWPRGAPYDLVFSWQLPDRLPQAWVTQCAPRVGGCCR